ncbi:hypothetical protein S40288_10564 [Stachybotrys chartarum IBT 40288]|nr:hypothetical protein S40288_10564 [Stachybotrys chartarum IBT 40288]
MSRVPWPQPEDEFNEGAAAPAATPNQGRDDSHATGQDGSGSRSRQEPAADPLETNVATLDDQLADGDEQAADKTLWGNKTRPETHVQVGNLESRTAD